MLFAVVLLGGPFDVAALALRHPANAAVFSVTFYRVWFPILLRIVFVLLPALWGMLPPENDHQPRITDNEPCIRENSRPDPPESRNAVSLYLRLLESRQVATDWRWLLAPHDE